MSAATSAAAAPAAPALPLSRSLCALLGLLGRGARREDALVLRRGGGRALDVAGLELPVRDLSARALPPALLLQLEGSVFPFRLRLATGCKRRLSTLSALAVVFALPKVFHDRTKNPKWPVKRVVVDVAGHEAARSRAAAILEPTAVLQAEELLAIVWALAEAVDVRSASGQVLAVDLLGRLAAATGASTPPATLAEVVIPCPGFKARSQGDPRDVVRVASIDAARVYTVETIEAALAATRKEDR